MHVNTSLHTQRSSSPHAQYDISPPLSPNGEQSKAFLCQSAANKRWKYLRRILKYQQMDFQYALWQMLYLFISPQKVYRNFSYRKQSKNQWARDDPAFLVLLSLCLFATSIIYALILGMSFVGFIKFSLWSVFIDCIGVGAAVASLAWLVANQYFLVSPAAGDRVEWGYCFDVHLNAFFPLLTILHGIGAIIYVILGAEGDGIILTILGNTLLLIAFSYYVYITFLGYDSLPILRKTKVLLFPFTILGLTYILSLILRCNLVKIFHLYNRVKGH